MSANIVCFAITLVVCVGVALLVLLLIWRSLAGLLNELLKLPPATMFYLRVLAIVMTFGAVSGALGKYDLKKEAVFIEYVWRLAEGLSAALTNMSLYLAEYLLLVTVLVAVLRRRHE